ncbi:MAG: hypothetical protein AAGG48_21445 [Planctomycetota bacterium]
MKRKQAIFTGILALVMITIWNSWLFMDWKIKNAPGSSVWLDSPNNVSNSVSRPEAQLWKDIKRTIVWENPSGGFEPQFAPSVLNAEGSRVELPGVGFLLSSGLRNEGDEEEVTEFLLLPGDGGVAWCCGLTPIPNHEFSVLVQCPDSPFLTARIDPQSPGFFVNVKGTLRLQKENSINSLYTLDDVEIQFIDIEDVLPPNVMNLCLNQPMAR